MFRALLKKFAPTWFASPFRRCVQAAFFVGFLALFFYVACPYPTRPARVWSGWLPTDVDLGALRIRLEAEMPSEAPILAGQVLYALDASASPPDSLGAFRVIHSGRKELTVEPAVQPTAEQLDRIGASLGPWALHEQAPGEWPSHYARGLESKEKAPAELFLLLDPLVSVSTAIAARTWVWSLWGAGAILLVCLLVPRGFCGYVCPMGTIIDLFDWAVGRRLHLFRGRAVGRGRHARYYLLAAVLGASTCGVLVSGFVAAIPVATRGLAFLFAPLQTAAFRGWYQVPPWGAGQWLSVGLFVLVLALGLLRPRFWCRYLCPTGAMFSATHPFRVFDRKVSDDCVGCNRCAEICPFGAIEDDYASRPDECALCRTCAGACPSRTIRYVPRWNKKQAGVPGAKGSGVVSYVGSEISPCEKASSADMENDSRPLSGPCPTRRGLLAGTAGGIVGGLAMAGIMRAFGARLDSAGSPRPVRPPGSVPEREFLALCVRCGECFRACPNDVLQPLGFAQGIEGLWTPHVVADWSGCETSCNNCGQVCPTGAIRALPIEEKRVVRMGLAVVDRQTCLPYALREACQLCVDECVTAGYRAIEFVRVGTRVDDAGHPVEESGFLAPVVLADRCVGCGLCQTRCLAINGVQKRLLEESAIRVVAGEGKEDRLMAGSYLALRHQEQLRKTEPARPEDSRNGYLPESLK